MGMACSAQFPGSGNPGNRVRPDVVGLDWRRQAGRSGLIVKGFPTDRFTWSVEVFSACHWRRVDPRIGVAVARHVCAGAGPWPSELFETLESWGRTSWPSSTGDFLFAPSPWPTRVAGRRGPRLRACEAPESRLGASRSAAPAASGAPCWNHGDVPSMTIT